MTPCGCAFDWRVEVLDLSTGIRRAYLTPLSLDFGLVLNEVGTGSVTLPVRSIALVDVWPHLTSVAFLRINGPGASPTNPVCEFIGMVEEVRADSGGTLQLGLKSIEAYLDYRLISATTSYDNVSQTQIGADLVNLASSNGIPLTGTAATSFVLRDRSYPDTDLKVIGDAVRELTQSENGPDYSLIHTPLAGGNGWETEMRFHDYVGSTSPEPLDVRRGVETYDLAVDGTAHATQVFGVGEKSRYTATDGTSIYPLFQHSEAWTDIAKAAVLQEQTEGYLLDHLHPAALPSLTLAGFDAASPYGLGDHIALTMDHGAILYNGIARITGISWSSSSDSPSMAALTLVPLDNTEDAILNAVPGAPPCC